MHVFGILDGLDSTITVITLRKTLIVKRKSFRGIVNLRCKMRMSGANHCWVPASYVVLKRLQSRCRHVQDKSLAEHKIQAFHVVNELTNPVWVPSLSEIGLLVESITYADESGIK